MNKQRTANISIFDTEPYGWKNTVLNNDGFHAYK